MTLPDRHLGVSGPNTLYRLLQAEPALRASDCQVIWCHRRATLVHPCSHDFNCHITKCWEPEADGGSGRIIKPSFGSELCYFVGFVLV